MLSMHRLVQAVLQDTLEKEKKTDRWVEYAVLVIAAAFPGVEYGTWSECECLLPHALQVAGAIKKCRISSFQAGYLLHETASYLHARGRYDEGAAELYQRALDIWGEQLGDKHLQDTRLLVDNALNNLANLLQEQGYDEKAESLYRQALDINERQRWGQLLNRAMLLNNLAVVYFEQEKAEKVEVLNTSSWPMCFTI
ncbi:MAG: tetratricopeptide repeat protein [Chloroflexi bacterium]|nr:MAG: tetratricopeptide repeat protein [Chloroflexota bacterium]